MLSRESSLSSNTVALPATGSKRRQPPGAAVNASSDTPRVRWPRRGPPRPPPARGSVPRPRRIGNRAAACPRETRRPAPARRASRGGPSFGSEDDHSAHVLAGGERAVGLVDLVQRVAVRDQLVQLQLAGQVQVHQAAEVVEYARRAVARAGQLLL